MQEKFIGNPPPEFRATFYKEVEECIAFIEPMLDKGAQKYGGMVMLSALASTLATQLHGGLVFGKMPNDMIKSMLMAIYKEAIAGPKTEGRPS